MRNSCIGFLLGILTLLLMAPSHGYAQSETPAQVCAKPNYRTDVRPNSAGPPTVVMIGLRVVDLLDISDVDQTITIDLVLRMQWTDPRLAAFEGCRLSIRDIWFPELVMKNSGRAFHRWPEYASIEEGGRIVYLQRVSGVFASYHKLAGFPFDPQTISIKLYPLDWSSSKVVFRVNESFTGVTSELNISDWKLTGVEPQLLEEKLEGLDRPRSGYALNVSAERYLSYFIWKIIMPIALIVFMSWSVFWIDAEQFGTQIGLSATSVLTMIAFIFATTSMLPRLGYFTMLDRYIAIATVFVFLALLQSLTTGYLAARGKSTVAGRIDILSRIVFPVAFFTLCYSLFSKVIRYQL